jgi:hypothetical protein
MGQGLTEAGRKRASLAGAAMALGAYVVWSLLYGPRYQQEYDLAGVLTLGVSLLVPSGVGAIFGVALPTVSSRFGRPAVAGAIAGWGLVSPAYGAWAHGERITTGTWVSGAVLGTACAVFTLIVIWVAYRADVT